MEKPDPDGHGYVIDYPQLVTFEHRHKRVRKKMLKELFPKGACLLYRDGKLVGAIPASRAQTRKLTEMVDAQDNAGWIAMCRQLCHPRTPRVLFGIWKGHNR